MMFSGAVFVETFLQSVRGFERKENIGNFGESASTRSTILRTEGLSLSQRTATVFAELQEFSGEGFPAHNIIIDLGMMYLLLLALMKKTAINIHNIISKNKVDEEGEY